MRRCPTPRRDCELAFRSTVCLITVMYERQCFQFGFSKTRLPPTNITKTQMAPATIWGIDYVSHVISSSALTVRLIEVLQEIGMEMSPD